MDEKRRKGARPGAAGCLPAFIPVAIGALILLLAWGMFGSHFSGPRKTLDRGVSGTFTLTGCSRYKATTTCRGTFRPDGDRAARLPVRLPDEHDADGVEIGESFAARRLDGELVRADGTGRANVREWGVATAGLGAAGLAMLLFTVPLIGMRPGSAPRRAAGWLLGLTVPGGLAVYAVWASMAGGV
ncbi:hypothetical protein [Actinomadura algeriensis]|uniref:DUF3592 domain-containing protein n=1 Tax=Actinomadura algeriensis TaxID=1679523 RepID=A0ABR9JL13_9ACTN|nr:hypothetical protein [Actinomadura algeriensis]MBE1531208.1 hypothetical protein [Actinomadura algeriensis]